MWSKTTSFWMAAVVASTTLFLMQKYAPNDLKPLTNRVLTYPSNVPTVLSFRSGYPRVILKPTQSRKLPLSNLISSPLIARVTTCKLGPEDCAELAKIQKPATPPKTTIQKIKDEVYEEQNGNEEFRYGYQVAATQTYVSQDNGKTCNDGGGTISGTYCAPNGERYNVNVASTNQAAANYNAAVVDKINKLTPEEVIEAASQTDPNIIKSCSDTACQQQILDKALETVTSNTLIAEKNTDVQNVKESYLANQKAQDYINLSSEELKQKYGTNDIATLLPTLPEATLKEIEKERLRQQAIISSAKTETKESVVNGKTVYTMTTTYTDPDTGKVLDTQTISYTAEASTTKEKTDEGFITHETVVFRDTKTGDILDAQTTSYILKSTTKTYKTAGRASGGTVENTSVTTTTATDANTGKVIQTTRTYAETSDNSPTITLIQNTTIPSIDGSGKSTNTITKSTIENPNYVPKTTPSETSVIAFNKNLGETCSNNTECSTGLCGRATVVAKNATCQPNPNQNKPTTASPESCPANTSLSCRGTACACLTQTQIVNLEKLELASNGNLPALAATIPENYNYKNDTNAIGNYAGANGNLALNKLLTYADTGWSVIPSWNRYKDSFSPNNVRRQWEVMNYASLEDCQSKLKTTFVNGTINGPFLCNDVVYSQEQFISSVDLGTDLTTIGAAVTGIPGALKAGGNILLNASLNSAVTGVKYTLGQSAMTALQAALPTIGTFGAISTANQTGNTAVSCLDGSDTCARDLGYTTLSWLNLGSMEYISSAMASGVATQIRNAQIVNTTLTVANAGTDLAIANDSCFGENKTTAGCLASAGVIAFDIAGGFFDLKTGQFIFQKVPDLNVNSAAIASLANNPVPPATKNSLDPVVDAAKPATPPAPNFTVFKNGDINNPLIIQEITINGVATARIDAPAIADPVLRRRAELTNSLLDEFAKDIGYQPYPAQVAELLSGKTVMQLKYPDGHALAGQPIAGKTDIIARIASVGEPRSIVLTKGTTEAMDYINTQMLGPGGRTFYQSQGTTGIFVHNELGFLEIDFTKGSFNPNTARVMSADEVSTLLKNNLDLPNESRLVFVADRPQAAWTRLKDSSSGVVMKDLLTTNTYGSMLIIADEISEDIKGVFAVSGSGIPLKEVADATLLGGVKSGDQAINIFKQAVDDSPTHQQFVRGRNTELSSGTGVAGELQNLGDGNFIPVDKTVYGNTLADIVDQSLKKWSHRNSQLGKNLTDLLPALRSGDPTAIKNFEALLAEAPPSSLLTDITFRKSSIQSDYNMLARVPGSDFGIEGNDLVLRKATATTGEKLSGPTDLLAFYHRGYDMTQAYNAHMIEKIDLNKPITRVELADISISPQGSKISVTEFYQEMQTAGHKLMGLDATPQEAISALYLKDNPIETKITPANLSTAPDRNGLIDQYVTRRASQYSNKASAVVLSNTNSDMNADLIGLARNSNNENVRFTDIMVAQYKKQPNGIEAEEYLAYPVKPDGEIDFANRRNLGDAQGWNTAIQSKLSGDEPQELLIVYMGRERAADLKITSNHDKIRWSLLFETSGGELPTEVSFEQMWRRNRIFNTDFSKSMDFDLYLTTTRTDLTPDNVQTAYFRENLNTKLANDRFTAALDDIAKSPVRAFEQIKALKNDKMSFVAAVRFKNLIERLEQEVGTFENILRTGLSPDLLTGDDLYRELHLRASRSNARILKMAEEAAQILGYSDGKLASLKNNLHVSDTFPDWSVFKTELDTPTTEFNAPESYGPADLLMAYAKNNSTSVGSAPQFRATNERYIAPTTPTTATAPRSAPTNPGSSGPLDLNNYLAQALANNRNNFVAIPTLNGRPLNNLINQPSFTSLAFVLTNNTEIAISREEDGQLYYSEDVNGQPRQVKISDFNEVIKRLPNPASIINIQLNEQDLGNEALTLNPATNNPLTLTTQTMINTVIETITGTILPTSSTSVSNTQLVDINPNTVFKNPSIGDQSIENILSTDNTSLTFTTLETEDGYVREFTVTGGQLYYSGNLESPRPISLEEALQLLPDPADVAKVDLNDQEVTKTYFLPIPVASHSYRRANDLSMAISSLISRSKIIQPPSNKFLHVSERYTPHNIDLKEVFTSTGFSKSIDPDISFLYIETTGDESSPLTLALPPETPKQSLLTINNVTKTIEQWLLDTRSDYYIKLSPNDTVRYGNHELVVRPLTGNSTLGHTQVPDQTKDLQARLTYLEELRTWATSIDPDIGPVNRFNRAIRYATYKQAVKEFEEAVQQRYQDLDTLHKVIFSYINENPDNHEGILNFTLEQAQKLSFTHTEINNILYAINGYVLQRERVSELRTRYGDSKDKIKEMWEAAFGFEPQGEIQIHYSYNTINLIPNNLTDFGRAYHAGDTTTKSIEPTTADIDNVIKTVGGFHKNNGTLIANTENIFNVVRDDETLAEVITHEDQHGLFKNLEKVFLPSRKNATLATKQEALNIELTRMSGLLDLSTTTYNNLAQVNSLNLTDTERLRIEKANLNQTAIYLTRVVNNDIEEIIFYDARPRPKLGIIQSLSYAGTQGKVIVFRGKGISDLANKLVEYAYDERIDAETDVANEILAQITGRVAIGVPLPDIKVEVAKSLRSHLYAYFVNADKSSTNFNTHETQPEWNQFRRTITQRYYTTKAQQEIVDNALQAYETLILKGWSHASASFLLQATRLTEWSTVARRALAHNISDSTPNDINYSKSLVFYLNSSSTSKVDAGLANGPSDLREKINQELSKEQSITVTQSDGTAKVFPNPLRSLTLGYTDSYGNIRYATYTSSPTQLADILDQLPSIPRLLNYENRDINFDLPISISYMDRGTLVTTSKSYDSVIQLENDISAANSYAIAENQPADNEFSVFIRFTNSLGLKEVYYPYGRTTYSNNNPDSPTTNTTTNTSVNNSFSAISSNYQATTSLSPTSTSDAFEQHLSKWNQIENDVIKPIQEEIKKPEILAERQEKYLEKLFSLINQMTKSPRRSTNNKILDQLRDLGYPYISEFGEWINIGDNVGKSNGYDTSRSYWTDAAKWVADQYSGLVSGYASGDLLLELKKAQLSQLELSRQNERKQLIEQFGQPMANLIRTYDDMQSRLPRLKPGQYSAVNEWRKKNAGKYFLLKRTYPKESLEGVNRARYGLDFRVDGLDPVNTTLDEASALFLSRWVQSHADEIDLSKIAFQHSTLPAERPYFDPLISTSDASANPGNFGDQIMYIRVPAEKLVPYSIIKRERINELRRNLSSLEWNNDERRNSQEYKDLNLALQALLKTIEDEEFMVIGNIDMSEITSYTGNCSVCAVEAGKVALAGSTAVRNQDIMAARQAINIANSHTYKRPDLQHMVSAFAYASMGIASSQKSFFNLALRELNNAEKKFNSYEQTGQLLGGNTTIDLSSVDLSGVDPRLIALLSNLPENGSVTAQNPDQVRNTLQTTRDYLKELGADTNNLSSLNPLMLQEITRRNVSRLLGDLKYLLEKNEENNIEEQIDNSTQLGFRLGYPGSDALARLVDNAILLTKNLLSRAGINFNYESIYSTQPTTLAETNPPPPLILNNSWIQNIILAQARISLAKNSKTYNLSTNELAILRRAIANGNTNPSSLSNIISTLNYPSLQDIKESLLSTHLPRWLSLGSSDLAPLIESIENINSTHPDLVHELIHTYIPSWINKGISSTEIEQITLSMRGLDRQTIISILPEIEHLYGSKLPKAFTSIDWYGLNEIFRALNTKPDLAIYIAPYLKHYSESISGASHVKLILTLVKFPDLLPQIHNYLPKWLEGNTSVESINNYLIRLNNNPSLITLAPYFNNSVFSIFDTYIIDALLQKPELVPEIITHLPEWSLVSSKYEGMNTVAALINELQQSSPARRSLYYQHLPTYISSHTRNTDYYTNVYENLPELIRSLNTLSDDEYQVIQQYLPDWISAGFSTYIPNIFNQMTTALLNSEIEYRSLTSDIITTLLKSGKFTNSNSIASIVKALNADPKSMKEVMKLLQIISQDGYPPLVDYVNTITKLQRLSEHLPAISTYLAEFHFQHKNNDSLNDLLDIIPYYVSHYSKEEVVHHLKIITKYPFAGYRLNRPDGPTISNLIQSTDSDTGKYLLVKELIVDAVANNRLVDITNFNIEINQKVVDLLENDELDLYINYLLNSKNSYPRKHQFAPDAPPLLRLFAEVPEVIINQFKTTEEFSELLKWKESVLEDPKIFYTNSTTTNKIFAGINSDIQDYSDKVGITVARLFKWLYADTYDSRLLTPITLSSWRIFNQLNPEKKALSNTEVADTLSRIDTFVKQQVRDLSSNSLNLPVGYRVSMGTEIEIKKNGLNRTGLFNLEDYIQLKRLHNMRKSSGSASVTIIDEQISVLTTSINQTLEAAINRYKTQIQPVHTYLGVGQGGDGTNEFALKPVADFESLIWELSELEQLGFISLNPQILQWIGERGIHITISGETGIKYDENADLLQNSLIATGYAASVINGQGGIQDAEEKSGTTVSVNGTIVDTTYKIARSLFARERGILRDIFTLIDVTGVEFRINSLSSIVNLSKTLRAYNRLSIPLMVYQRNLKNIDEAKLLQTIKDFVDDPTLLETIQSDYNEFLLPEVADPLERKMVLLWAYYRTQSIYGFAKYQLSGQLASPLNKPVSKQLITMDGELGQVFKTTEEESSRLLDDAFASYHEAPPKDSLPWFMQKLVDETVTAVEASFESNSQSTVSDKTSAQRAILPLLSTGLAWSTNASISVQNTVLAALQIPVNPFFAFLPDLPLLIHQVNIWFSNLHLLKDLAVANVILPVRDATIYFFRNVNPNQEGFAGSAGMLRIPIFTRPLPPTATSEPTSVAASHGISGRLLHPIAGLDDILPIEPVTSTKAGPHITMLRNLSRRPSSLSSELGYDFTLPATNLVITAHDKISDVLIPNQTGQSVLTANEGGAGIGGIRGQHSETITLKATNLPLDTRFNSDEMDLGQATLLLKAQIDSIAYLANLIAREQMVTTQTYDPEGNPQYELNTVNSKLYPPSSRSIRFTYPVVDNNNQHSPVWYFEDMTIQEASRLTQNQLLNLTKIMSGEFVPDDKYLKENSHRVVEEWFSYNSNKDDIPPIAAIGYAETNPRGNVNESHPIQMFDHRINIRFATYFTKTINKKMGPVTGMVANEIKLISPHSLNGLPVKNTVNNLVNRLDFLGFDFETPKVHQLETVVNSFSSDNVSFAALTNRSYIGETDPHTNNQIQPSTNLLRLLNIYSVETQITIAPQLQNIWQDVRSRLISSENIKPPNLLPYLMSAANLYDRGNPTTIYHPVAISGLTNTIQMAGVTQGMANAPLSRAVFGETTLSANDFQRELSFNSTLLVEQSKNDPKDLGATTPDYFLQALKANAPGMQQLSSFILSDFAGTINAPIQVSYLQRLSEPGSTIPINISTFKTATTAQTRVGIGVIDNNISLVNTGDIYTLGKTIIQMLSSTKYPAIRQYFVAKLSPSFFKDTLDPRSPLYKRVMRILKGQEQINMDDPILKQTSNETNRQILIILGSSDPVATFQYLYATTYINLKEVEATKKVVEIFSQAIYNVIEEDSRYSALMNDLYIQNTKIMSLEYIRNLYQTVLYFNHMASTPTTLANDLLLTIQAHQETEHQLADILKTQVESLNENR